MYTLDIANEIFSELGEPDTPTAMQIDMWLQQNVGQVNILLGTEFIVNDDDEIVENFGEEEKAIYKELYYIYYYNRLSLAHYGAGGYSINTTDIKQVKEGDSTISLVSKTEKLKELKSSVAAARSYIQYLIDLYLRGKGKPLSKAVWIAECRVDI